MRKTHALVQVALAIMQSHKKKLWGYELSRIANVRSGVLYPILHRMLDEGWLIDGWEELDSNARKRPPRRYYELTDTGRIELGAVLRSAQQDARFASTELRWALCSMN